MKTDTSASLAGESGLSESVSLSDGSRAKCGVHTQKALPWSVSAAAADKLQARMLVVNCISELDDVAARLTWKRVARSRLSQSVSQSVT